MLANEIRFCLRLAKALAVQFGPNCEIVVHDLGSNEPEHSIVAIENGHVSGRKVGGGPSQVVLEALRSDTRKLQDRLDYLTRTEDGRLAMDSAQCVYGYIYNHSAEPTNDFFTPTGEILYQ